MPRIIFVLSVLMFLFLPGLVIAADLSQGEKDTIFIDQLKVQPSVFEKAARDGRTIELRRAFETLETQFTTALSATRIFQLVERKNVQTLSTEQQFSDSGMVDIDKNNAAKSGKMLGAKFVFIPIIDGFEDISNTKMYQSIGRSEVTRNLFMSVVVQIVDTSTGALLPDVPSVQLKKTDIVQNVSAGQVVGGEELVVSLAKELAQKLSQETVLLMRPAKILSVTGKQVLINRGTEAGFNIGDQIEIYAVDNVKDDDTGEIFRNEIPVGQVKIIRIDKQKSFAMINGDDLGIAKGCIAKLFYPESAAAGSETDGESLLVETPDPSEKPQKW